MKKKRTVARRWPICKQKVRISSTNICCVNVCIQPHPILLRHISSTVTTLLVKKQQAASRVHRRPRRRPAHKGRAFVCSQTADKTYANYRNKKRSVVRQPPSTPHPSTRLWILKVRPCGSTPQTPSTGNKQTHFRPLPAGPIFRRRRATPPSACRRRRDPRVAVAVGSNRKYKSTLFNTTVNRGRGLFLMTSKFLHKFKSAARGIWICELL